MITIRERQKDALQAIAFRQQLNRIVDYLAARLPDHARRFGRDHFVGRVETALTVSHRNGILGDRECCRLAAVWLLVDYDPAARTELAAARHVLRDTETPDWARVAAFEDAVLALAS